jgi:hypothetical protein
MSDSILAIAQGIAAQSTVNADSELTTGLTVINLISSYLSLQSAWSKTLSTDAENIYIANMNVPGNPSGTASVAAATQTRNVDSTTSDSETGNIDNIIQGQKGQAQILGNAMSNTFSMQDPVNELLKTETDSLQQMV